jgi:hypothetical protein
LRTQTVVGATILRTNKAFTKNVLREIMPNAKCQMPNAKCQMPNAKCQMPNAKCQKPNAKCQMPNAKCQMPNAKCQMPNASLIQAPFPSARDYMAYAKTVKLSKNKKKQKKWVYLGTVFTRWLLTILGG